MSYFEGQNYFLELRPVSSRREVKKIFDSTPRCRSDTECGGDKYHFFHIFENNFSDRLNLCTGGPRFMRSFYLQIRVYEIGN